MIRRAKGFELMIFLIINLNTFGFDLENYGFWKCAFNKSCSCLYDKGHELIIYII
jgi:hypothetical protein